MNAFRIFLQIPLNFSFISFAVGVLSSIALIPIPRLSVMTDFMEFTFVSFAEDMLCKIT